MMHFDQYKQIEKECGKNIAARIYAHEIWANSEEVRGVKADLRSANLRCADLRSANLDSANLRYADLRSADLRCADLRYADLDYADLRYANLDYADLRYANLGSANLGSANLRSANLRCADLGSANLDYSVWPLWCGSLDAKIDKRIAAQLFYHACNAAQSVDDDEVRAVIAGCKDLANTFHRTECERIK